VAQRGCRQVAYQRRKGHDKRGAQGLVMLAQIKNSGLRSAYAGQGDVYGGLHTPPVRADMGPAVQAGWT
jgi:hypothetical protein